MKYILLAGLSLFVASDAMAQDFVSQCTEENIGGDEVLCQANGVWGTCQIENDVPTCGIAYCPSAASQGDSCVVAGNSGGCIPLCEVDFNTSCDTGEGMELVCEVGDTGMFDSGGEDITCATGTGAAGPSLLLAAVAVAGRRRRERRA